MITAYRETAEIVREQIREAKIDLEALQKPIRACEISRCRATCCHDGVYLSEEEKHGIEALVREHGDYFSTCRQGLENRNSPRERRRARCGLSITFSKDSLRLSRPSGILRYSALVNGARA